MVLWLPIPSLSRSDRPRSSLHSADSNNISRPGTTGAAAGKRGGMSVAAPPTNSATLNEALRNNPFGNTSRSRALEALSRVEEQRRELQELNDALMMLTELFPDVKIEVFRELLTHFDGQSRLQVCVEQLLRYGKEWVRGRWNTPDGEGAGVDGVAHGTIGRNGNIDLDSVALEDRFRSEEYKTAVKTALSKEFGLLSRSVIDAVLAEANFSYTRARPTMQELSRKGWRVTLNNLFPPFRRKKDKDGHPLLLWQRSADGELIPRLKETGCPELDRELYHSLVEHRLRQKKEEQEARDLQYAEELNHHQAEDVDALYECDCCLSDVTFEQISTCSANGHIICHICIRRTIHEALFGQGWDKSVNLEKSTLKCLAPLSHSICEGSLNPTVVKNAILSDKAGAETYRHFEDKLASETLLKSQMKLIRCPFCSYAEVDPVYHPSAKGISWRLRRGSLVSTIFMMILLLDIIPLLIIPVLIILILSPPAITAILTTSLQNLCLKSRSRHFFCANPSCRRRSCITCRRLWRDPHVCHEPLLLSLRRTIEAARTAAVKRTCPRCGLSFVKSSGCNKLTCVCGYSMCYLCRKALGSPLRSSANNAGRRGVPRPMRQEEDRVMLDHADGNDVHGIPEQNRCLEEEEEAEGYKHFCDHFRINPGTRCTECNKCDLYLAEDEEAVAHRAGEQAEREWRMRQGMLATPRLENMPFLDAASGPYIPPSWDWDSKLNGRPRRRRWCYWFKDVWCEGRWRLEVQAAVNWVVEKTIVVVDV